MPNESVTCPSCGSPSCTEYRENAFVCQNCDGTFHADDFRRWLSQELVETLVNNAFWRNICADRELQPEIGYGSITVYHRGQALLTDLRLDDRSPTGGSLTAAVDRHLLPLESSTDCYNRHLPMRWRDEAGFAFDPPLSPRAIAFGTPDVLQTYKRIARFSGAPDGLRHRIAIDPRNRVLDQEIGFKGNLYGRIDLAYFDRSIGKLCFAVIKHCADEGLLAPSQKPAVVRQLRSYGVWLAQQCDSIVAAYGNVVRLKRALGLGERVEGVPEQLSVLTRPVLIIGGCTDEDVERIRWARFPENRNSWLPLWPHLEDVAAGLIVCRCPEPSLEIKEAADRNAGDGDSVKFWFG
ncbi:MAG TPA: hypothetical protein VMV69_19360 [Pirellulales bacterium]|nr:hypothetical protein [Pirellulales bacterium]